MNAMRVLLAVAFIFASTACASEDDAGPGAASSTCEGATCTPESGGASGSGGGGPAGAADGGSSSVADAGHIDAQDDATWISQIRAHAQFQRMTLTSCGTRLGESSHVDDYAATAARAGVGSVVTPGQQIDGAVASNVLEGATFESILLGLDEFLTEDRLQGVLFASDAPACDPLALGVAIVDGPPGERTVATVLARCMHCADGCFASCP